MIKYSCYDCRKKGVFTEVKEEEKFISHEGKILCSKCKEGIKETEQKHK